MPTGDGGDVPAEHHVDRVGQAADRATALVELADLDLDHLEAPRRRAARRPARGTRRHHDGVADHDRVGTEGRQRLLVGEHQRLGDEVEQRGRRGVVEGARRDHRASLVERAEREVEVVHRRVGDAHAAHPDAEVRGEVLEGQLLGARAVARDERVAPGEDVAGLEMGADAVASDVRRGAAAALEPRLGGERLHPALGVAHVGHHHVGTAVGADDPEAEVHRVDHVGGVGALRDDLDGAAEALDRGDQADPLRHRAAGVGLVVEIHVRVDPVVDAEVVGSDHHVAASPRQRSTGLDRALDWAFDTAYPSHTQTSTRGSREDPARLTGADRRVSTYCQTI